MVEMVPALISVTSVAEGTEANCMAKGTEEAVELEFCIFDLLCVRVHHRRDGRIVPSNQNSSKIRYMLIPAPQLNQILDLANIHKVIAIGEMHGVKENPEIIIVIYQALKSKYPVIVGLEYPQTLIDNPESAEEVLLQDGRYSPFHKEMLESLKNDGAKVFGLDLNITQVEEQRDHPIDWRDQIMAKNVNLELKNTPPETKVLLVTGDIHYQTAPQSIIYPDKDRAMKPIEYMPMGAQLETSSILAIHLRYLSGQFYNFKLRQMPKIDLDKNRSFRDLDDVIEIDIQVAHPTRTE